MCKVVKQKIILRFRCAEFPKMYPHHTTPAHWVHETFKRQISELPLKISIYLIAIKTSFPIVISHFIGRYSVPSINCLLAEEFSTPKLKT